MRDHADPDHRPNGTAPPSRRLWRRFAAAAAVTMLLVGACGSEDEEAEDDFAEEEFSPETEAPPATEAATEPEDEAPPDDEPHEAPVVEPEDPADDTPVVTPIEARSTGDCGVVGGEPHPPVPIVAFPLVIIEVTDTGTRVTFPTEDVIANGSLWIDRNAGPGIAYSHEFNVFVGPPNGPSAAAIATSLIDLGDGLELDHEVFDLTTGEELDPAVGVVTIRPTALTDGLGFDFEPIVLPEGWGTTGFEASVFVDDGIDLWRCHARLDRGDLAPEDVDWLAGNFGPLIEPQRDFDWAIEWEIESE